MRQVAIAIERRIFVLGHRIVRPIVRPALPVLFVSGYTRDAILQNGILGPGVHLLNKPFTTDELAGKVREVIESMRAPV